jgi:hypothetical protein
MLPHLNLEIDTNEPNSTNNNDDIHLNGHCLDQWGLYRDIDASQWHDDDDYHYGRDKYLDWRACYLHWRSDEEQCGGWVGRRRRLGGHGAGFPIM